MNNPLNRREFLGIMVGGAASSVFCPFKAFGQGHMGRRKMNVLFIAVDDLRPQLGCYGQKQIISPNIDRLAARGLLFERAYCQQSVCAPSRASILTGARPDTTKIYDLNTPVRKAMPDVVTLPEHFKKTVMRPSPSVKSIIIPRMIVRGWSVEPYRAGTFPEGAWKGRGYLTKEAIAQVEAYAKAHPNMKGRGPAFEAADVPDGAYPDGANTEHAIRQLRRLKDQSFFLAMGFYKPHLPFNAPVSTSLIFHSMRRSAIGISTSASRFPWQRILSHQTESIRPLAFTTVSR